MAVHRRRAFEQDLERLPAERQRRGKADRGPERVAAADAFGEGQDAGLVHSELHRFLGRGGEGDDAAIGIGDAALLQPGEGGAGVQHRLGRGEGLGGDDEEGGQRVEIRHRLFERGAVDVGNYGHVVTPGAAA